MTCSVCDRKVTSATEAQSPRRRTLLRLCVRCHGLPVRVRTARQERLGAHTFYVDSFAVNAATDGYSSALFYTVKAFSRRMTCDCPDYTHRGQVLRQPCKHVRLVRLFVKALGGIAKVPRGADVQFRLASPSTARRDATRQPSERGQRS